MCPTWSQLALAPSGMGEVSKQLLHPLLHYQILALKTPYTSKLQLKPPFTPHSFPGRWHLKALSVFLCIRKLLSAQTQQIEGGWLFYGLQLFLQLTFQGGTLLRTTSPHHMAKWCDYLTGLKTCYSPERDKSLLETEVWFHFLWFTRYLPGSQAPTASAKNFRNLGRCVPLAIITFQAESWAVSHHSSAA